MSELNCANPSCDHPFVHTIWRGFALCDDCLGLAYEVPNERSSVEMMDILGAIVGTTAYEEMNPGQAVRAAMAAMASAEGNKE